MRKVPELRSITGIEFIVQKGIHAKISMYTFSIFKESINKIQFGPTSNKNDEQDSFIV